MFLFTNGILRKHTTASGGHAIDVHIIFLRFKYMSIELDIQTHNVYQNSLSEMQDP